MADSPEQRQDSIPVCTLFNEGDASDGGDVFGNVDGDNVNKAEPLRGDRRKSSEPKLCNVFAEGVTSDQGDDIFAKISEDKLPENSITLKEELTSSDAIEPSENTSNSETPETASIHNSKSVDSFIVEELAESDVNPSVISVEQPAPSIGPNDLDVTPSNILQSVNDEVLKDPIIASPSFISVTSFSVSTEENSSLNLTNLETSISEATNKAGSMSNLATEAEGLTIENVAVNMSKLNITPTPGGAVYNEDNQESTSTESLFSHEPHSQHTGLFSNDDVVDMDEDDPFAAALNSSAIERRRDAWLPSESTKAILVSCLTNQVTPEVEMEKTTRPGLSSSELLEDPVKQLVVRLTGSENVIRRENLTMDDVSQDRIGIQKLMESGNHRSAANLCSKLLTQHNQGFGQATHPTRNTPESLWLWYSRIYILTKLKLYETAAMELIPFGNMDNPDLYYEFYPGLYPGRRGSMVPFEFRMLHAEFPRYVEKPQECLRRLHLILATCEKIIHSLKNGKTEMGDPLVLEQTDVEASLSFWINRKVNVLYCIGNALIQLKDYILAVKVYERILTYTPENSVKLHSGMGRLYLHIGDIRIAQQHFTTAEKEAGSSPTAKVQLLLNRGFMYIGANNWREAYSQFQAVLDLEPHNIIATNNKAVCLLYLGKLKDAINVLENGAAQQNTRDVLSKVQSINRQQMLVQGILGNLSTLYELESSQFVVRKRSIFLKHIAQNCGDSFDASCFKGI